MDTNLRESGYEPRSEQEFLSLLKTFSEKIKNNCRIEKCSAFSINVFQSDNSLKYIYRHMMDEDSDSYATLPKSKKKTV